MRIKKYYYFNDNLVDEIKFYSRLVELSKVNNKVDEVLLIHRLSTLMKGDIIRVPIDFQKKYSSQPLLFYYFKISFIIERTKEDYLNGM